MSKLPSSQLARASVVGSTAVKVGVGKLKTKAKRPFLSEQANESELDKQHDKEAELLFKAITQLRGTAVKMAQMLGMETDLLPEKVRIELSKSYYQVPPLNRVLVKKVIQQEFGEPPENLYKQFDLTAMAAASLGQVHRAELDDGQVAAVKVQYPGIHVSIESDVKLMRKLSGNAIRFLPNHRKPKKEIVDTTINEIAARLMEETDYELEARNTSWFKQHLVYDGVEVPHVYDELCSKRVITTQMLKGRHIDDWLATNPSQQHRDKAAQLIYDCFVHCAVELGRVHADPNPGNYLFKDNGELALIDFGCVKQLGKRFTDHLPALLYAFYLSDFQKIVEAYSNIGMSFSEKVESNYQSVLQPFGEWLSKPVREEYFDFKVHNDYTSSGLQLMKSVAEMPTVETVEKDFIFFDRTMYGLFKIFERLEAKVYMRAKWETLW